VQNFLSAAVGIVIAIALVRGFIRSRTGNLGNFWVDLSRITIRVLLPLSVIGALVLAAGGAIDNRARHGLPVPAQARRRDWLALGTLPR
jgi:K+-transporting ATPase ATPase A chain